MAKKNAEMTLAQKLAHNLKEIETARGLTPKGIVEASKLPQMSYYRLRSGFVDPKISTIEKVSKALNVTPADLLK
jgi:transcriptional regulator with XRE-family HTH domain